jgi:hypothetical protein
VLCLASSHVYQPCFPLSLHKNPASPPVRLETFLFDAAFLLFVFAFLPPLFLDLLRCISSMTVYGSDAAALEAAGKKQVLKVKPSWISFFLLRKNAG